MSANQASAKVSPAVGQGLRGGDVEEGRGGGGRRRKGGGGGERVSKQAECPGESASFREAHLLPGFLWRRRCAGNSNRAPPTLRHRSRFGSLSVSLLRGGGGGGRRRPSAGWCEAGNGNGSGDGSRSRSESGSGNENGSGVVRVRLRLTVV